MASSRIEDIPDVGPVRISKKRGVKRISLRLHSSGEVRVTQPFYLPFSAGVYFAKTHSDWIGKQKAKHETLRIYDGMMIGKQLTLQLVDAPAISTRVTSTVIYVKAPKHYLETDHPDYILAAKKAIKRALVKEAKELLPERVMLLADQHGYQYRSSKVKPMKTRWGSCSHLKDLTFNCYLMMLPWDIIDYVIAHELSHTKYMNHSAAFWDEVALSTPNYKERKRDLKQLQPKVHAFYV